jgi:hypothetical protein
MTLVAKVHIALLAILAVSSVGLIGAGCGGIDLCPGPQLGVFTAVILVILGACLAVRAFAGRSSPLAVFDAVLGAFTLGSAISNVLGAYVTPLSIAITVLSVLAIVGAVLAAREVPGQGRERTVLIVALIIVIILLSLLPGGWFAALVPVIVIASIARPRAKPAAPPVA